MADCFTLYGVHCTKADSTSKIQLHTFLQAIEACHLNIKNIPMILKVVSSAKRNTIQSTLKLALKTPPPPPPLIIWCDMYQLFVWTSPAGLMCTLTRTLGLEELCNGMAPPPLHRTTTQRPPFYLAELPALCDGGKDCYRGISRENKGPKDFLYQRVITTWGC